MECTTTKGFNVVAVAFWTVEGRGGVFKTVESLTFGCAGVFHNALKLFYPDGYDSDGQRREVVATLQAGEVVHLDGWGLQVMLVPGGSRGGGGKVGSRKDLETFFCQADRQPKQVSVAVRPG